PERADHRIQTRADRGIAHPELALDVLEVAARLDERLEELELLPGELVETTQNEGALETSPAALALEARDTEGLAPDGAPRDLRMRLGPRLRSGTKECQAKQSTVYPK